MFKEYTEWAKLLGCDSAAKLNEIIAKRQINHLKWIAEGLHEQKLCEIADKLAANFSHKRIVTIAGPSSSNKTTFAKRLAIYLRVNGYESLVIEMDDYFRDGEDVPYEADGLQDFEKITAMNIEVLGQAVRSLIEGKNVPRRKFIFSDGKGRGRDSTTEFLSLPANGFLIVEGIHGMNPIIFDVFGGADKVCPIYVSALTPVNIDNSHRFPTTSLRLIRRMVRDYKYRGQSPRQTLRRWGSVRRGEEMNIFPFQVNAELFFNSALVYELPVLAIFARAMLAEASLPEEGEDPDSPETLAVSEEALRLLGLLKFFYPVSPEIVPHISFMREFIGGSDLKY
jgi:uridine kinase